MLGFEEARSQLLSLARVVPTETVRLAAAQGRVLREAVTARAPRPAFDNSAMDGYALATSDLPGDPPFDLAVAGTVPAGAEPTALPTGCAFRIFTGAALPARANAVLLQENASRVADRIHFTHQPQAGEHVRRRGSDLAAGSIAIPAGIRLNPFHLGLCASLEALELTVAARPRVTLLCTGNELHAPGTVGASKPAAVVESNSPALAALLQQAGAQVHVAPYVKDDLGATQDAFRQALAQSDIVISVGGVSVGDHDHVKAALNNLGAVSEFWKVRIKPGKPLLVARLAEKLVLGLPGNPVSAQLTCTLFALPLLRALQGQTQCCAPFRKATLLGPLSQKIGRAGFFRARWLENGVLPLTDSSSGSVLSMAEADAVIWADENQAEFPIGSGVPVMNLYEAIHL